MTVQNEDGLTIYWKALKHSESFAEIKLDLERLRSRLNSNLQASDGSGESVKVLYVGVSCITAQVCIRIIITSGK